MARVEASPPQRVDIGLPTRRTSSESRPPSARVIVLDRFEVLSAAGDLVPLPLPAQRLLAFLAVNPRPLLRCYVAGTLWSNVPEAKAAANLRSALWRVRRTRVIDVDASAQALSLPSDVTVDYRECLAQARWLLDEGTSSVHEHANGAPDLGRAGLGSELLPGWYEDWVVIEREHFRQVTMHALERACELLAEDGRFSEAVEAGLAAVAIEPLRESAHRGLIRAHLAEGNPSEAMRHYRIVHDLFSASGMRTSDRLRSLVTGISGSSAY